VIAISHPKKKITLALAVIASFIFLFSARADHHGKKMGSGFKILFNGKDLAG
tara:strand:- start:211 stop:366 length:156 start_codon:yes stop_codon:yes gene_type:complete